jgi:hypothetical protein
VSVVVGGGLVRDHRVQAVRTPGHVFIRTGAREGYRRGSCFFDRGPRCGVDGVPPKPPVGDGTPSGRVLRTELRPDGWEDESRHPDTERLPALEGSFVRPYQ